MGMGRRLTKLTGLFYNELPWNFFKVATHFEKINGLN